MREKDSWGSSNFLPLRYFTLGVFLFSLLLLSQAKADYSAGNQCHRFYEASDPLRKKIELEKLKKQILEIASRPEFDAPNFDIRESGEHVKFMFPLVEHAIEKASRELEIIGNKPVLEKFESEKNIWISRMKNLEMTYAEMLAMAEIISIYLDGAQLKNETFVAPTYVRNRAEDLIDSGVVPLPMFFTPDFELRTRLWALDRPPISIVKKPFYSLLDNQNFTIRSNIPHDWFHASEITMYSYSKQIRRASNQALVAYMDKQSFTDKKFGFFFLHQIMPEGTLGYETLAGTKIAMTKSVNQTFKNYFHDNLNLIWLIESLGLMSVRFETTPGQFVKFEKTIDQRNGKQLIEIEGSREQFISYISNLKNKLIDDFTHVLTPVFDR
jgi:hypothetical protein